MQAVMLSIRPKWCELIASGKKTIEVRKTRPKLDAPFKCYIYCTRSEWRTYFPGWNSQEWAERSGKVIGEFMCGRVEVYDYIEDFENPGEMYLITTESGEKTCLNYGEFAAYGAGKPLYGWHISDLVIYDRPREMGGFRTIDNEAVKKCQYRERMFQPEYITPRRAGI